VAKMRPRRWRGDEARAKGTVRGAPRRARVLGAGGAGTEQGEIIARLERMEALIAAIAAHLRVERPGSPPGRVGRGGPRPEAARAPGGPDHHAVVKTVARRLSGRLKLYHPDRGYGFVVSPDAPGDVFFHRTDCRVDPASLEPSAAVLYDVVEMANGQSKAVNLTPRRPPSGAPEE
jgi:cold shock CspA family protein